MDNYVEAIRLMELFVGPPRTKKGAHCVHDFYAGGWKFRLWSHSTGDYDVGCYHHGRELSGPSVKRAKTVRGIERTIQSWIVDEVIEVLRSATVLQQLAGA